MPMSRIVLCKGKGERTGCTSSAELDTEPNTGLRVGLDLMILRS